MEYYGYIYKTTNLVTQKIYVGQKKSQKFLANKYLGSGIKLKSSIQKYGEDSFNVELLEWCYDENQLNSQEVYWIEKLDAMNPDIGYNLMSGGYRCRGIVLSEETKKILSEKAKGRPGWNKGLTKETDERVAISGLKMAATRRQNGTFNNPWNKGLTKETSSALQIVSQKTSGVKNGMYGKHLTDEQKSKCVHYGSANGRYGKHLSADVKEKISIANKGRTASEETKHKLSEMRQGRRWYTNGITDILVSPNDDIPSDYYPGRTLGRQRRSRKNDRAEIVD